MSQKCYYFENGVRCTKNTFRDLSYCPMHVSYFTICPFTYKTKNGTLTVCHKNVKKLQFYCSYHYNYMQNNRASFCNFSKASYPHANLNDKDSILQELYGRTNYYIKNKTYPDRCHLFWMTYLANKYISLN